MIIFENIPEEIRRDIFIMYEIRNTRLINKESNNIILKDFINGFTFQLKLS